MTTSLKPTDNSPSDIQIVEEAITQLIWWKNDLVYRAPEQFGGVYTYLTIFMAQLEPQISLLKALLNRAKEMADALPPSLSTTESVLRGVPGWAEAVEWSKSIKRLH